MVIRPKKQEVSARQHIDAWTERHWENGKPTTRRVVLLVEIREDALNSGTIWMHSVGIQHPSDGKVCAYDWLASISDKGCTWHGVLAGSDEAIRAPSPWSRQKMLWHNLAAGLTEDEKSFGGQKVCSFYWHGQQSAQMNMESPSVATVLSESLPSTLLGTHLFSSIRRNNRRGGF